jgi:hypothetical protein
MKKFVICFLLGSALVASGQDDKGTFSGNLIVNNQFFQKDDKIGANTELYTKYLSGTDAWLFTNYTFKGFHFSSRFDLFNNSNLYVPTSAYTNSGLAFWQISKDIDDLNITAGYFYDQFGSGSIFRAYEDRNLGIDYAIQGVRLIYEPMENLRLKAFTGRQKYRFGIREPIIKGFNAEYIWKINDRKGFQFGASILNRTLDANSMNIIVNNINNQPYGYQFFPKYNAFMYNGYASYKYKNYRFFGEYCGKTNDVIRDYTTNINGSNPLALKSGRVLYASGTYSKIGLGINAQYKRIQSFPVRTSANETTLDGVLNYLPSITRQNTYRLLARYNAVVQEMGEEDFQADVLYTRKDKKKRKFQLSANASYVRKPTKGGLLDNKNQLFHEFYIEVSKELNKKSKLMLGVQNIGYNQQVYENKSDQWKFVKALTGFGEFTHKFNKKKSLRVEAQYLSTKQDLGSFLNILAEYNIAPRWSFATGDMVNIVPVRNKDVATVISGEKLHYYTFFGAFTHNATRFTLGYVKQVQGVNCTGGVCRVEPAFSGLKFTCSTSF